jgi:hypothetical protein
MTPLSNVVFIITFVVKESIILKGLNHIGGGSFPNPFFSGVE